MEINQKDFLKLNLSCPFSIFHAARLTQSNYCGSLSSRNFCGKVDMGNCNRCYKYIRAAFAGLREAKSPTGLLVWRLRDQAAKAADTFSAPETGPVTGDPFGSLLEELDEGKTKKDREQSGPRADCPYGLRFREGPGDWEEGS